MWFSKRRQAPIRTLIGEGTALRGDIHFTDGLRIDGEVHGDIVAQSERSLLVISENARVHGKVKAGHVIINGEIKGPVHSDELLELQPRAKVAGDVRYELLEMHQGAVVDGVLRPLRNADKPALKLAASNDA
jgi:cytoskeletal protein CcmA (bactofilin family)